MDALLLALVLTLALDQGSPTQMLAARFGKDDATLRRIAWLMAMVALNAAIAATLGGLVAHLMTAEAALLFFAIALLFGALGQIAAPFRSPRAIRSDARPGRTAMLFALRRAGENGAFAVAGVAAFTHAPVLAAIGATLGGWAALLPPLILGERPLRATPFRAALSLAGIVLLCAAIACAVSALRLS